MRVPRAVLIGAGWTLVFAVAALQEILGDLARGRAPDARAVGDAGLLILLWAVATPLVFRSVARWPVRGGPARRHVLLHATFGVAFVLLLNALIRVPLLARSGGGAFAESLGLGLLRYGPMALVVYGVLVALGHAAGGRAAPRAAANGGPLALQRGNGRLVIDPAEIEWIEARDNYVRIYGRRGPTLVRERISDLEDRLDGAGFVRIHRSTIVAVRAVREVRPGSHGDAQVILRSGEALRVTRTRRGALERALSAP